MGHPVFALSSCHRQCALSFSLSTSVTDFPRYTGLYRVPSRLATPTPSSACPRVPFGLRSRSIQATGAPQPWDFGRFIQTLYFFNAPPSLSKFVSSVIQSMSGEAGASSQGKGEDLVLVTGATGGVGKRVVDELRKRGVRVRALVRSVEKAKKLLKSDVEVVAADVTQGATLLPEFFEGVTKIVVAHSCIVGPKEGDTADRQKYYQGVKFFDPEVKGDSPEAVEYRGVLNLLDKAKQYASLPYEGRVLFGVSSNGVPSGPAWGALDDVVMGGVSASSFQISAGAGENGGPAGLFKGYVSTANNGGFASIRSRNFEPLQDLSAYDGFEFRVKGDGHRYKFIVRTTTDWDAMGYTCGFDTVKGEWHSIRLPFSSFVPVFRAKTVKDAPPFDTSRIASLQLLFSKFEYDDKLNPKFEAGPFELPIASIKAYLKETVVPHIVHLSSAGVTRPERPGLDLSKQPPAVRMNKELGYILTYKLKGEDAVRESGIPYVVIRPCALTEEPAGAELEFEQGDNITGKVAREEVARIIVEALWSPAARDKTFEVKSTVPFSQPFTVDPAAPPPPRDYEPFFKQLSPGITGKEALEKVEASSV